MTIKFLRLASRTRRLSRKEKSGPMIFLVERHMRLRKSSLPHLHLVQSQFNNKVEVSPTQRSINTLPSQTTTVMSQSWITMTSQRELLPSISQESGANLLPTPQMKTILPLVLTMTPFTSTKLANQESILFIGPLLSFIPQLFSLWTGVLTLNT